MRVSIFAAYQAPSVVNEMVSSSESGEASCHWSGFFGPKGLCDYSPSMMGHCNSLNMHEQTNSPEMSIASNSNPYRS